MSQIQAPQRLAPQQVIPSLAETIKHNASETWNQL